MEKSLQNFLCGPQQFDNGKKIPYFYMALSPKENLQKKFL
jgi:hypothetical protein